MYYVKIFLIYSFLGFVMESTLFKIINSKKHSGIFYGPMTIVYGVGIISIELLNEYFFEKIKHHKVVKIIIEYITLTIVLSIIELIGGNIANMLFDIDMWDYSSNFMHLGKYVCLKNSLIWGLLGVVYIHIFKKFTDKLINQITQKETYLFLTIFIIDTILLLITKL